MDVVEPNPLEMRAKRSFWIALDKVSKPEKLFVVKDINARTRRGRGGGSEASSVGVLGAHSPWRTNVRLIF